MAKMYPAQVSPETKSGGEIEIFRRIRDDPLTKNWIVLHSLDIASHRSQIAGELDFVVIVPNKGVLCVEVKAAKSIKRENGLWYYGAGSKPDARGPFKQVSEGMHSIRKKLVDKAPEFAGVVFWSAVVFPYVEFPEQSPEWHQWQIIDSRRFTSFSIGQNFLEVLNQARNFLIQNPGTKWFRPHSGEPDNGQCKQIAAFLRPEFECYESPQSRAKRRADELKHYTREQFDALDGMISNPRVIFTGPAGTGKTFLAIEAARRCQLAGKATLLVCFNRMLGNWLKEETSALQPGLVTSTLHGQMLVVSGVQPPAQPNPNFWDDELPCRAVENLIERDNIHQFDSLIVDEAQDILKDTYLDFLDLILKGGLASGNWMMFGDFEKQAIYEDGKKASEILQERFRDVPRFSLRVNCRNTPRIAELVHLVGQLSPGYSRVRRPDNNLEPKIMPYKSIGEQQLTLEKILMGLEREKVPPDEIVILSTRRDEDCIAMSISDDWLAKVVPAKKLPAKPKKIKYGTIHSFKGLEAPVIIMTDVEEVGTTESASLFYVGITRALDRLYILVNEKVRQELLNMILGNRFDTGA